MAFWFNRYKNYTKRGEVYLFTLKDYCEIMMIKQFGGCYLVRKDMPMKDGYLMEFPADQVSKIATFVKAEGAGDGGSVNDQVSYVTSSKIFQMNPVSKTIEGDGSTTVFQISSKALAPVADDIVAIKTASGVKTKATVTVSEGTATLKISDATVATIALANGLVTFSAAPAATDVWNISANQIAFTLNYQLLGNVLYAGLAPIPDPKEVEVEDIELDADGEATVFKTHANLKPSSITIDLTPTGDDAEEVTGITDDGEGNLKKSSTTYGTIDYVSGEITLEAAPAALSYSATYFVM